EDRAVEQKPCRHQHIRYRLGEVVDAGEARRSWHILEIQARRLEIDLVKTPQIRVVDEIEKASAYAANGRNLQFPRANRLPERLRAEREGAAQGGAGVIDEEGGRIGGCSLRLEEGTGIAGCLGIDDDPDIPL